MMQGWWVHLWLVGLLLSLLLSSRAELNDKGVNYEVVALMNFKAEIWDPHMKLANWDGNEVDPCSWSHVICSSSNSHVTKLVLSRAQLSGTLSPSIGDLPFLEILILRDNNFSGSIPDEIGKLLKLDSLDLSNNQISGQIPDTLGQLKNLHTLRLNNNGLAGPIPSSLADPPLDIMDLSFNNLSGSIPNISNTKLNILGNPLLCGSGAPKSCPKIPLPFSSTVSSSSERSSSNLSKNVIRIGVAVGTLCFMALLLSVVALLRRHDQKQATYEMQDGERCYGQIRKFSFFEMQSATDNFSSKNILGKGGFGYVYRGFLSDGTTVAIKRLNEKCATRGEVQFQTEMEMISLAVHRNLLRLLGYCVTASERLLVYPYMSNGSVASRLREKPALDWTTRRKIALGAARGLVYLHEQCDPKIIHRDVKAANILLDKDFQAVVGDFGLAKLLDHTESHVTTIVLGTAGHIAPEYLTSGQSSEKTDVFGFGIFLLELITGQRAIEFARQKFQQGHIILLERVKALQQDNKLKDLVDVEIKEDDYEATELEAMVQVMLLCTCFLPIDRPKMGEVVRMLEGDGLAEKWEMWKRVEAKRSHDIDPKPQMYYDLVEDDSLSLSGVQLSGPR